MPLFFIARNKKIIFPFYFLIFYLVKITLCHLTFLKLVKR